MEESQTSSKKGEEICRKAVGKTKDYTFSSEDLLTLDHWEQTLKTREHGQHILVQFC